MLEAWFLIAAGLLIISGGSKLIDPAPTAGALRAAGLPAPLPLVYAIAVAEIVAALTGTLIGGWACIAVAILYLGFALFVIFALARNIPIASCGCFGRADTPPTRSHVVFNLVSAGVASWLAAVGTAAPIDVLSGQPLVGLPYLAFVTLGVFIVYLLLTELPLVLTKR